MSGEWENGVRVTSLFDTSTKKKCKKTKKTTQPTPRQQETGPKPAARSSNSRPMHEWESKIMNSKQATIESYRHFVDKLNDSLRNTKSGWTVEAGPAYRGQAILFVKDRVRTEEVPLEIVEALNLIGDAPGKPKCVDCKEKAKIREELGSDAERARGIKPAKKRLEVSSAVKRKIESEVDARANPIAWFEMIAKRKEENGTAPGFFGGPSTGG